MSAFVIGICGKAGAGKSTVADMMAKELVERGYPEVHVLSFADPMRDLIRDIFSPDDYDKGTSVDTKQIHLMGGFENATYRRVMQTLGTEWGREMIDENIWIDALNNRLNQIDDDSTTEPVFIIPDVRHDNEAMYVTTDMEGILAYVTGRCHEDMGHQSEHSSELDDPKDYASIIFDNTGTLADLHTSISDYLDNTPLMPSVVNATPDPFEKVEQNIDIHMSLTSDSQLKLDVIFEPNLNITEEEFNELSPDKKTMAGLGRMIVVTINELVESMLSQVDDDHVPPEKEQH